MTEKKKITDSGIEIKPVYTQLSTTNYQLQTTNSLSLRTMTTEQLKDMRDRVLVLRRFL